jgi:hypothetical protein
MVFTMKILVWIPNTVFTTLTMKSVVKKVNKILYKLDIFGCNVLRVEVNS